MVDNDDNPFGTFVPWMDAFQWQPSNADWRLSDDDDCVVLHYPKGPVAEMYVEVEVFTVFTAQGQHLHFKVAFKIGKTLPKAGDAVNDPYCITWTGTSEGFTINTVAGLMQQWLQSPLSDACLRDELQPTRVLYNYIQQEATPEQRQKALAALDDKRRAMTLEAVLDLSTARLAYICMKHSSDTFARITAVIDARVPPPPQPVAQQP